MIFVSSVALVVCGVFIAFHKLSLITSILVSCVMYAFSLVSYIWFPLGWHSLLVALCFLSVAFIQKVGRLKSSLCMLACYICAALVLLWAFPSVFPVATVLCDIFSAVVMIIGLNVYLKEADA